MKFFSCIVFLAAAFACTSAECLKACTREYMPVCGSDGVHFKVFSNLCVLENEHCADGHAWYLTEVYNCLNFELEEEQRCERPCPRIYKPVCGSDGEHVKVFPNSCEMQNEHCRDGHTWVATRVEDCHVDEEEEKCKMACPLIYSPVCGFDGQTYQRFPNKCMMEVESCLKKHNWVQTSLEQCQNDEDEEVIKCPTKCPRIYRPICGFDGETYKQFPNECVLRAESCRLHHHWEISTMNNCV